MGDDSPDEIELGCTSCETEFIHEGATGRLPSVPCPECGEPVSLQGSDPEEEGGDESPPEAQIVDDASDEPMPPAGAEATGQTLMGVGPQAVSTNETGDEDTTETGDTDANDGDDGDDPPLAKITGEDLGIDMGEDEDDAADESPSGDSTDEGSAPEESGGEESVDRSFVGAGDDDVHDRETSVSREPLSKMSPGEDGGEQEASDTGAVGDQSSDGGRLSDLKRRLQQARHKEDDEQDSGAENPFKDVDGNVGSEETQVASDAGLDDGFGEEADADEAMEVTVEGDESTGDDEADEEIPKPDVEFGGGDEPQNPREENRETKPAGEDTILETMQSGGGSDEPDESVETAEQSLPEEAVETAERVNPEEADTAEQPVADADEEASPDETPAVDQSSASVGEEPTAEASETGDEPEVIDESDRETKPNVEGGEREGVPGPDEMDQETGLGSDSSVPRPDEIDGGDEHEASDSGGEPSRETGLGGSSSVPRPGDVRGGDDEEVEDGETPATDTAAESGSEPAASADVDEETRRAAREAGEDLDLEKMSREMADEASDIINEMRDEGELEPEAAAEEDDAQTAGSGAPPIPDETDADESGGSGAPPVPEDVGPKSDGVTSDGETGANSRPKPESGSGSIPAPEPESGAADSQDDNPPSGQAGDSGPESPASADRSGGELPKPVAEADVEFPDTSPGDDAGGSPVPPEEDAPGPSSASPAADQPEPPMQSDTAGSEPPSDPSPAAAEQSEGGSATVLIGAGLAGVVLIGAGIFFLVDPMGLQQDGSKEASEAVAANRENTDEKAERNKQVGAAVQAARSTLGEATAVDVSDADLQREVADRLAEKGDPRRASRVYDVLWDRSAEDTELANRYIDLLMDGERYRRARHIATQAAGFADGGAGFEQTFDKTLEADDTLGSWEPVELDDSSQIASIGASSDVDYSGLVLRDDAGQPVGLWRPATDEDGPWRDSIAAWRLCQIVACQFEIPRTRPSRISRSTFEAKFDGESGDLDPDEFDWVTRQGPDGGEVEYLYGALRDWPGEVTRWPIEEYDVWRPWLTAGGETEVMEQPVSEAVGDFEDLGDGSLHSGVVAESEGLEVRPVARQLSGIITFDFLTNNWGRFEDDEADYGASNHFADGGLVTMETDTVFQRRKSTRVKGRFRWISRFSGDMVRSIRLLDKQSTRELLYPDASSIERAKFDIFWEQRDALLSRVDELTDEHGRDDVLLFR